MKDDRYRVVTSNKFMMDSDSSDSDDEQPVKDVDPYALLKQKEAQATQKAKKAQKEAASQAKKELMAKKEAKEKEEEERKEKEAKKAVNKKREPRANFGQRRGKRNPQEENAGGEQVSEAAKGDGVQNRQRREKRQYDRRSGNPRTGVKSQEKRGGAGAGNWGKPEEQGDLEEIEKQTPEETENPENIENADPENENVEEKEPEPVEFTLEEYLAGLDQGTKVEKKNVRQANDGKEIKGKTLKKKEVFGNSMENNYRPAPVNPNTKQQISLDTLGFHSDYSRNNNRGGNRGGRGGRGGNRGGRRDFNERRGGDNKKQGEFKIVEEAFPTLGKAK